MHIKPWSHWHFGLAVNVAVMMHKLHIEQQQLPQFLYYTNIAALLLPAIVPILLYQNLLLQYLFAAFHIDIAYKALLPVPMHD